MMVVQQESLAPQQNIFIKYSDDENQNMKKISAFARKHVKNPNSILNFLYFHLSSDVLGSASFTVTR